MGTANFGSASFFWVIAPAHGGRSEVMETRPGRAPANEAPVRPATRDSAPFGTGLIASAGYILLNTRTGFWLVSLMASRPLWKQFDPLEILYAWEEETKENDETKEETLLSLVD